MLRNRSKREFQEGRTHPGMFPGRRLSPEEQTGSLETRACVEEHSSWQEGASSEQGGEAVETWPLKRERGPGELHTRRYQGGGVEGRMGGW